MTSRDFCYWLQGFFDAPGATGGMNPEQVAIVKAHLAMVFLHEIDPSAGPPAHQAALDALHNAGKANESAQQAAADFHRWAHGRSECSRQGSPAPGAAAE